MIRRLRTAVARDGLVPVLRDVGIVMIASVGSIATFALAYLATIWIYEGVTL